MSKIELTDGQARRMNEAYGRGTSVLNSWEAVANELVAMGLVRPASDDLAARVAAFEGVERRVSLLEWKVAVLGPVDTEPPPGWEESQSKAIPPKLPEPRTDADRLGESLFSQFCTGFNWNDAEGRTKLLYCNAAHAVRKADRAGQLEPSEEEIDKACDAYLLVKGQEPGVIINLGRMVDALRAAARVRLEKAEGEKP